MLNLGGFNVDILLFDTNYFLSFSVIFMTFVASLSVAAINAN